MSTTRYFDEQVRRKWPYLTLAMCNYVVADSWGRVTLPDDAGSRILRVVTLADGTTIHNAFLDRGFREEQP